MNTNVEDYLEIVPQETKMTPDIVMKLLKKYRHNRSLHLDFSAKHTKDIEEYRQQSGHTRGVSTIPSNLYNLPVTYNTDITGIK